MANNHFYDYEGSYLFSEDEMFPRENVGQEEFNSSFAPIVEGIKEGFAAAEAEVESILSEHPQLARNKTLVAGIWNELIVGNLVRTRGIESGRIEGNRRRIYFRIGRSKVFVKKVDSNYRTSNIETGQVAELREQLSSNTNDLSPVLFLGYQLDGTSRHITKVSVICRKGEQIEWVTDVLGFNDRHRILRTRVYITLDDEPEYNISVKPGLKSRSV